MIRLKSCALLALLLSSVAFAQIEDNFDKGTHEFGISNIGIGYSSANGFAFGAQTRYQHYFINRFSAGGTAFYNNIGSDEWYGAGPTATYILFMKNQWFSRLDQQVVAAKYNGFSTDYATMQGSTGISINYVPMGSHYSLGAGYIKSYALSSGRAFQPDLIQLSVGFFF